MSQWHFQQSFSIELPASVNGQRDQRQSSITPCGQALRYGSCSPKDRCFARFRFVSSSQQNTQSVRIVRGTIDSLVVFEDRVVVVDYKTGTPGTAGAPGTAGTASTGSHAHRLQVELYLEAARELFPDRPVEGLVFYASGRRFASHQNRATANPGLSSSSFS